MQTDDGYPRRWASSLAAETGWKDILDLIPAGAYVCDSKGLITYFNSLAQTVWGRVPALRDATDRYCGSLKMYLSDGTAIPHAECWMALALRYGAPYNAREIQVERPDGSRVLCLAHANPLRNVQGEVIGAINLVVDITARKRANADRHDILRTDDQSLKSTLVMIEAALSMLTIMPWAEIWAGRGES